jgi:hypothetical protein
MNPPQNNQAVLLRISLLACLPHMSELKMSENVDLVGCCVVQYVVKKFTKYKSKFCSSGFFGYPVFSTVFCLQVTS